MRYEKMKLLTFISWLEGYFGEKYRPIVLAEIKNYLYDKSELFIGVLKEFIKEQYKYTSLPLVATLKEFTEDIYDVIDYIKLPTPGQLEITDGMEHAKDYTPEIRDWFTKLKKRIRMV